MKEVSELTGCNMRVFPKCLPNSNERVVALGANDPTSLMKAITMVITILDTTHHKPPTQYFQEDNNNDPLAMMNLTNGGVVSPSLETKVEDPSDRPIYKFIVDQIQYKKSNPVDVSTDYGAVETTTTLVMSNDMCGAVIGKGGQNIRAVRSTSMARIDFTRTEKDSG